MADVTKEEIEKEKRKAKERISKRRLEKGLAKAKILGEHAKDEPFPSEESLLEAHKKIVQQEKKISQILEPRNIRKPNHHLEEAEKVSLKKAKKKPSKKKSKKK